MEIVQQHYLINIINSRTTMFLNLIISSNIDLSDIDDYTPEEFAEIDEDDNELEVEEVFAFTSKLRVLKVIYTTVPVEYPDTSANGVMIKDCPFFGDISVKKDQRTCQGIKFCEFTDQELVNQEHCSVDFDSEIFQLYMQKTDENTKEVKTYTMKPDEIDISLLQNLFAGFIPEQTKTSQCSIIVSKSCKRKKCVRFIKFIPNNITECSFIALVCIEIHNHPPPSPERTLSGIKNNLQSLIEQDIHENDTITSRSLLSENLIKAYFNKETLAEVHVSLNNIDKLRYLMERHIKLYIHLDRELWVFIIMYQIQVLIWFIIFAKLISLQVTINFKRVKGEINEFEINTYDSDHHLILSLCRVYIFTAEGYHRLFSSLFKIIHEVSDAAQAKGLGLALHDLDHEKDWQTHLTFVFKSCLIHFESKEQVYDLLQQIRDTNDKGIEDWLSYYQQLMYKVAHTMVNKEGKQLSLLSAISRGKRYDERCYKTIEIHDKTGVPYTHQDKSEVKRIQRSIKRKEDSASENEETALPKTNNNELLKLDIEERKMILREREIKIRAAEAEARLIEAKAEALELENQKKKYNTAKDK
ncbi:hypothetical protein GLOIN_2v1545568 [Rhizophagus irregularis DAOM 181602=DAOM 197198]|nr:hypothetical protein GLOIN_2v1545568 [Rhizophagus irregularis DAOM 181602=DAOM 197198]